MSQHDLRLCILKSAQKSLILLGIKLATQHKNLNL